MRKAILVTLLFLISTTSVAGIIKGAGATSCGLWIEDRKSDSWFPQVHWIQGFISSYNHFVYLGSHDDGVFGNTDAESLAAWMDNYCRENPLTSVYEGTIQLITELNSRVSK